MRMSNKRSELQYVLVEIIYYCLDFGRLNSFQRLGALLIAFLPFNVSDSHKSAQCKIYASESFLGKTFVQHASLHVGLLFMKSSRLCIRGGSRRTPRRGRLHHYVPSTLHASTVPGEGGSRSFVESNGANDVVSSLSEAEDALRPPPESWTSDPSPWDLDDVGPDPQACALPAHIPTPHTRKSRRGLFPRKETKTSPRTSRAHE